MATEWRVRSTQVVQASVVAWTTGGRNHDFPLFAISHDPSTVDDFRLYSLIACVEVTQGGNQYHVEYLPRHIGSFRQLFTFDMEEYAVTNYKVCIRLLAPSNRTVEGDFNVHRLRSKLQP